MLRRPVCEYRPCNWKPSNKANKIAGEGAIALSCFLCGEAVLRSVQ